ncbi:hypothetical protein [Cupriavidus pauculus]|uniref:hypothetical protein n=1 Tax=Cupriavidus pauculus TaxID=82633 RepID=UPI0012489A36|nr:hypothetical protein [Cupriavidus pauculus]KAB0599108.1 hypothetical protein F7R19_24700 [Cupriavidus pauculus]UAL01955.1 hypothetical protein K8O84_24380 [Cupriavidus pauculus]
MLLMAIVPLAGASALGVLSEYATYNYAIHYGFRPAFEGVPYLKATVTLISFLILLFGALVFTGIVFLINYFVTQFSIAERLADRIAARLLTSDEGKRILATNPGIRTVLRVTANYLLTKPSRAISGVFWGYWAIATSSFYLLISHSNPEMEIENRIIISICLALFVFAVVSCLIWEKLIWLYATMGAVTTVVATVVLMFNAPVYAEFLRLVGYGGGIPIQISEKMEGDTRSLIHGYLMLRTTDSLLLYNSNTNLISEYSRSAATEVAHAAGGLRRLPFALPQAQ